MSLVLFLNFILTERSREKEIYAILFVSEVSLGSFMDRKLRLTARLSDLLINQEKNSLRTRTQVFSFLGLATAYLLRLATLNNKIFFLEIKS